MIAKTIIAAGLLLAPFAAHAQASDVKVTNAWSRATPPGATTGVAYFTLSSPVDDTLTGVSSPVARMAQVHNMTMDGNVMRMREVTGGLPLPAGKAVMLQPDGYHVMLMGLTAPLKRGQTIALHLTFAKASPEDITAPVGALGSIHPPGQAAGSALPGMKMP